MARCKKYRESDGDSREGFERIYGLIFSLPTPPDFLGAYGGDDGLEPATSAVTGRAVTY